MKSRPDWPFYHQGRVARMLGIPNDREKILDHLPSYVRREAIKDGNGGWVWAFHGLDIDRYRKAGLDEPA